MNDRLRLSHPHADAAASLIAAWQPGDMLFSSRRQTLLTHGATALLAANSSAALAREANHLLRSARRDGLQTPLLIGALPFRSDVPARLLLPELIESAPGGAVAPVANTLSFRRAGGPGRRWQRMSDSLPPPAGYRRNVEQALRAIAAGRFEKVVLSRSLRVPGRFDLTALLPRLAARNPAGYTFALDLDGGSGLNTLVGASPELLLSRQGRRVRSHPLAGSIPRSPDPAEDQRRAVGLLASAKDRREHALVADAVAAALRPHCTRLSVPAEPSLVATPTLWHLGTEIRGELHEAAPDALALALALHPTPAVCGHPAVPARDFILANEGFDRGHFTGLVGWCDANGDGEWAVTIRCAEVGPDAATLYAGAGIVAGSEPDSELAETAAKLDTLLQVLGLGQAEEVTA